ncbi:MAG: hypothetical protein RIB58_08400 [Phycisphaerales bacterium]
MTDRFVANSTRPSLAKARLGTPIALVLAWALLAMIVPCRAFAHGPLPERWVPAECDWVVHIDAQRLARAQALRPVFDVLTASTFGASLEDMGIDARMDLTGITVFGTVTRGPEARGETTTLLQGGAALRDAIKSHVQAHGGYTLMLRQPDKSSGHRIDAWTIDSLAVHIAIVPVSASGTEEQPTSLVAVLSDNSHRLQACIASLLTEDGSAEHEATQPQTGDDEPQDHFTHAPTPEGSVISLYARGLNLAHPPLRSELLASAERLVGHLGYREQGDSMVVFADLELQGHEQADLASVVSSLNRMIGYWGKRAAELGRQQPSMLHMLPLVQACDVSHEGRIVRISMEQAVEADRPAQAAAGTREEDR